MPQPRQGFLSPRRKLYTRQEADPWVVGLVFYTPELTLEQSLTNRTLKRDNVPNSTNLEPGP